jgi:DNA-binding transcriptional ArsR family regulator
LEEQPIFKWVQVISAIGDENRLAIMLALHNSGYVKRNHIEAKQPNLCDDETLSFSQIQIAANIRSDASLSYHLSKLIEAKLVDQLPTTDTNEPVFSMYKASATWKQFTADFGITEKIKEYVQHKYPSAHGI